MYHNYLYSHSFATLEDRFEKGVILSNPFHIDPGRIFDLDKTEILRASYKALRMTNTVKLLARQNTKERRYDEYCSLHQKSA